MKPHTTILYAIFCFLSILHLAQPGLLFSRIIVEALINKHPAHFLLDTKSVNTVLFAHAAARIGLAWEPGEQPSSPGRLAAGKSQLCDFDTGGGPQAVVFPVVNMPQLKQQGIDGVLSWESLKNEIVFLDGERQQFSALKSIPEWAQHWQKYSLKQGENTLVMETRGEEILIDTANDAELTLAEPQWQAWQEKHKKTRYTLKAYSTTLRPVAVERVFLAQQYRRGRFQLQNVLVEHNSSPLTSSYGVSLGMGALRQLNMIVDGPRGCVYVHNTGGDGKAVQYNRLGAVFIPADMPDSDRLTAVVADNSPAARAGLKNGDELLQIGELDVRPWKTKPGILPLGRFWRQPAGTKIVLQISRDGRVQDVEVALANFLEP